jgi:BirA family biotin operon repressor/biotin-[acetyl-CoA-carboxylase] ligase
MNLPAIGHSFQVFDTISSTNMYAMNAVREGLAEHGDAFFSYHQTAGRGQRGKKWWSAAGENIQLSVVLQTAILAPSQRFRLSAAMAVGTLHWLQSVLPGPWKIKWPNDLYWNDRKAGGILIENIQHAEQWTWAIAGFGININSKTFDPALPNPISLKVLSGETYDLLPLAHQLCACLEQSWQKLTRGGWPEVHEAYNSHLMGRNSYQKLKTQNAVAQYLIKGVDEGGQLVAGSMGEYRFSHGEAVWVI